jgi:hypothetical protein
MKPKAPIYASYTPTLADDPRAMLLVAKRIHEKRVQAASVLPAPEGWKPRPTFAQLMRAAACCHLRHR